MASPRRATSAGHSSEMELLPVLGELGLARAAPLLRRIRSGGDDALPWCLERGRLGACRAAGLPGGLRRLPAQAGQLSAAAGPGSSALRRSRGALPPRPRIGALEIDAVQRRVAVAGRPVRLSRMEFELLSHPAVDPTRVYTKQLLREVSGFRPSATPARLTPTPAGCGRSWPEAEHRTWSPTFGAWGTGCRRVRWSPSRTRSRCRSLATAVRRDPPLRRRKRLSTKAGLERPTGLSRVTPLRRSRMSPASDTPSGIRSPADRVLSAGVGPSTPRTWCPARSAGATRPTASCRCAGAATAPTTAASSTCCRTSSRATGSSWRTRSEHCCGG
jgi:hypothetical protein